jgi:hypothetical protein
VTSITSASNTNINLTPGGSGEVRTAATFRAGALQIATATLSSTTSNTDITLQPNGNGEIVLDGVVRMKVNAASCSSSTRGILMFQEEVSAGDGDKVLVCIKKTDGNFGFMRMNLVAV